MSLAKQELFYEIYKLLKAVKYDMSMQEIINEMEKKGYKRTTVANLFNPCILQPLTTIEEEKKNIPLYPILSIKVNPYSPKIFYQLNPDWRDVPDHDAKTALTRIGDILL